MKFFFATLLLSTSTMVSACIYGRAEGAAWSYTGSTGPTLWHTLSTEYKACGCGKTQSPIDIDSSIKKITGSVLNYPAQGDFTFTNDGHAIKAVPVQSQIAQYTSTLGGKKYNLQGFHFHTTSEHTIKKKGYPLEAHFVHEDSTGAVAVFGIFFQRATDKGDALFEKIPFTKLTGSGDSVGVSQVALSSIIAHARSSAVFNYGGSLTTPPCTEGVNWFVAEKPLTISATLLAQLAYASGFNSRFTQAKPGHTNILAAQNKTLAAQCAK